MEKKSFFKERSSTQIQKLRKTEVANVTELVDFLVESEPDEYAQIMNPMFSKGVSIRASNKYEAYTYLRNFHSIGECLEAKVLPYQLMRDEVNSMDAPTLGFMIFPPKIGLDGNPIQGDTTPYVIPWLELFEGARVFAYSRQQKGVAIEIGTEYGRNIPYEGKTIVGLIPSRRKKIGRSKISLSNVPATPLRRNLSKKIAAWQFYLPHIIRPYGEDEEKKEEQSRDSLEKRRYANLGFYRRDSGTVRVITGMWADIALYLEYIRRDTNRVRNHFKMNPNVQRYDPPSIQFTPFPMVTKFAVEVYKKIRNNTLNHKNIKPRDAEVNLAIGELARQYKHGRVFFSKTARDGKVGNYDWSCPENS